MPTNQPFAYIVLYSRPDRKYEEHDMLCITFSEKDAKEMCNHLDFPTAEDEQWLRQHNVILPDDRTKRGNFVWYMPIPAALIDKTKHAPEMRALRERTASIMLSYRNVLKQAKWYMKILHAAGINPWDGSPAKK